MSDCNVNEIMAAAGCYACLSPEQLEVIQTELLCRIYTNGGGGGGTPGGLDQQVQFNDGGVFGGDAGLVYNKTTNLLTAGDIAISSMTAGSVLFAGASGAVSQDNANLYWDDSTNKMSIGPRAALTYNVPGELRITKNTPAITGNFAGLSIEVLGSGVNTGNQYGFSAACLFQDPAGSVVSIQACEILVDKTNGSATNLIGLTSVTSNSGGSVSTYRCGQMTSVVTAGTITTLSGCYIQNIIAGGTITTEHGLFVKTGSGGTVTNRYGIYLDCDNAADIGITILQAATHTGNAFQLLSSASAVLMRVTSAGSLHIFNTYTDESNYERAAVGWSGNILNIGSEALGTGTARAIKLFAGNAASSDSSTIITINAAKYNRDAISITNDGSVSVFSSITASSGFNINGANAIGYNSTRIWFGSAAPSDTGIDRISAAVLRATQGNGGGLSAFEVGSLKVGGTATINQITKILQGSDTHDFASVAAGTESAIRTVTITGAAAGDPVFIGLPDAASTPNIGWSVWVSAANTVSYKFYNRNAVSAVDLGNLTYKFFVHQL